MDLFALEHSRAAYRADFAFYGAVIGVLATSMLLVSPRWHGLESWALALTGLAGWTAVEYMLHRFVLHGLPPFSRWHAEHHRRPTALICAPTVLSAASIFTLVFLPALLLSNAWRACALTLGVLSGYLAYAVTHHATHHWRADAPWLKRRKRWHALHHHSAEVGCYGVTSAFWDHVFGSAHQAPARAPVESGASRLLATARSMPSQGE